MHTSGSFRFRPSTRAPPWTLCGDKCGNKLDTRRTERCEASASESVPFSQSKMTWRSAMFGAMSWRRSGRLVNGSGCCTPFLHHSTMADLSYVWPLVVMAGSVMSSMVIGHRNASRGADRCDRSAGYSIGGGHTCAGASASPSSAVLKAARKSCSVSDGRAVIVSAASTSAAASLACAWAGS